MPRKKNAGKINTVPKGISFMYAPQAPYGPTVCPTCGSEIEMTEGGFPTCNDHSIFECADCGWVSPSGEFQHTPTKRDSIPQSGPTIRKQASRKQTQAFVDAFRDEYARQMDALTAERAKFPPSLIQKRVKLTKGKTKIVHVSNPKFTNAMREHMHTFAVDSEKIAEEIVLSGIRRWEKPKAKGKGKS